MFGFAWLISKAKFWSGLDEAARLALEFYLIIDVIAYRNDRVAQLVARFLDMEEVAGSSPATITNFVNQTIKHFANCLLKSTFTTSSNGFALLRIAR